MPSDRHSSPAEGEGAAEGTAEREHGRPGPGTPHSVPDPELVAAPAAISSTEAVGSPEKASGEVSGEATDLARARAVLLAHQPRQRRLRPEALRAALADLYDFWLASRVSSLGLSDGVALVAVGALGRRELAPYSDLDLVLVHSAHERSAHERSAHERSAHERRGQPGIAHIADKLWYPLWDAGIGLDHSVRTVGEAVQVAGQDLRVALGLLEARHLAGDASLTARLVDATRQAWRAGLRGRLDELVATTQARWQRIGEIAHRVEPDLKSGRGGLRDVHLIDALAVAQVADRPLGDVLAARALLLDVRTELHRSAGRARDVLRAQDAAEVAVLLDLGDRFDLARALAGAARMIAYATDVALRSAHAAVSRRNLTSTLTLGMRGRFPARRPLDDGVVEHAGEVALARDAHPTRDPALVLRLAAAAARCGMPIAAGTLRTLADIAPELREPWPRAALDELLSLLGAGPRMVEVVEALDRTGLWGRLFPEWGAVRDLPPRDPAHTWTVDRHLVETVARASRLTTRVARPDLLLLGALLHDIGKGRGDDHSVVGAALASQVGRRLGLWPADVAALSMVVRHHLLLPHTATRRDLEDEATVRRVVDTLDGDAVVLEVLHALAEADALATGPGVWSDWKSALVDELVRRATALMAGDALPGQEPLHEAHAALVATIGAGGGPQLALDASTAPPTVTVVATDRIGLLSRAAGVLALHSLEVHSASVGVHDGVAVCAFEVSARFGSLPDAALLRESLVRALDGTLSLAERLERKERDYAVSAEDVPPPAVLWFDDEATGAVVLELRTTDRIGLLHRVAAALDACEVDVRWARVATLGRSVVDSFCIVGARGGTLNGPARRCIEHAVLTATH
jgi:[protein-PII] uridylyltransferase